VPHVVSRFRPLPAGVPLLVVTRGGRVESVHRGSVAVVAGDGRLLAAAGDPLQAVFLRSAAKPFQLTPFLAAGGEKRFRLSLKEIALAAASHGGEPFHTRTALGMLEKGGFTVEDLRCGAHAPMRAETARELSFRREKPSPLHNNCSGKHAAMLLACRLFRYDPKTYWQRGHPLQKRILSVVSRMTGVPKERIGLGVDGCSVPALQVPLYNLALSYARLTGGKADSETAREYSARKRIVLAMTHAPEMVAGTGRFTTALMREFEGGLVGKEGAEGVYAIGVSPGLAAMLPGGGPAGIALKIEDGAERGRDAVALEVMRQLGVASGARLSRLQRLARRPVRDVRGDVVGGLKPVFSIGLFATGGGQPL
jgi:L-asparaginase II